MLTKNGRSVVVHRKLVGHRERCGITHERRLCPLRGNQRLFSNCDLLCYCFHPLRIRFPLWGSFPSSPLLLTSTAKHWFLLFVNTFVIAPLPAFLLQFFLKLWFIFVIYDSLLFWVSTKWFSRNLRGWMETEMGIEVGFNFVLILKKIYSRNRLVANY